MRFAVIVPVHNRKNITLNYLRQMLEIDPVDAQLDIVIVDDGSTDGTAPAIRDLYPNIVILQGDGSLWWTGAINMGVRYAMNAHYDYVLVMNDDLELAKDFLVRLMEVITANPGALVSSVLLNKAATGDEEIIAAGFKMVGFFKDTRALHSGDRYSDDLGEIVNCDLLTGASLAIPVQVFRAIGIFDNINFPHNWGDFEFTRRASLKGYACIVAAKSKVFTEHNQNYPAFYFLNATRWEYLKNLFNYTKFNYGFKAIRKTSYMHRPILVGTLLYLRRIVGTTRLIILKLLLTKNGLRKVILREAKNKVVPQYVIRMLSKHEP